MGRRKKKKSLKAKVWNKSNGLCAKCGKTVSVDKQTIDHFIPKYHGGTDDFRNLIPLCKACNRAKGASWLCYYKALQLGDASKVVPIDKLSVVITLVLAFVFLHEDFTIKSPL